MNYQKQPVLECRSIRPATNETEIPTGIELRQTLGGRLLAYLVPVVKTIDADVSTFFNFILSIYTVSDAKYKSAREGITLVRSPN